MKSLFIALIATGIVALTSTASFAQGDGPIQAKIPFAFSVRDRTFPAGDYVLSNADDENPDTMELRSQDGKLHILFNVESAASTTEPARPDLVFDKVGDRYFLSQVFSMDGTEGGQLGKCSEETQLESKGMKVERRRVPLVHIAHAMKKVVKP